MNPLFFLQFISKHLNFAIAFLLTATAFFAHAQNPTVINDSLVVNNRVYAKEKLIVDQEAKFKQDIKVLGTARLIGDIVVDGNTKLNGNVRINNISELNTLSDSTRLTVILPNGQLKTVTKAHIVNAMYAQPCGEYLAGTTSPAVVTNPVWNNGPNKLYVSYCDNVNVGIGTNGPQYLLDVRGLAFLTQLKIGAPQATQLALINGFDPHGSRDILHLGTIHPSTGNVSEIRFKITHDGTVVMYNHGGHSLIAYDNVGGKILQLENDGLLRTREIRIDAATWADFVFDKNYELPKLKDVAKYIEKNHHLPGIPSASELQETGINVGEMQTLQMQKIEELTLYMIEMDKKMEAMQAEITNLKKENDQLKQSVTK
jgi:hypothetical protein